MKTTLKALELYRAENEGKKETLVPADQKDLEEDSQQEIVNGHGNGHQIELQNMSASNSWEQDESIIVRDSDSFHTKKLKSIKAHERTHFQREKLIIIVASFLTLVIVSLVRRNEFDNILPHIKKYSLADIVLCSVFLIICVSLILWSGTILKGEYKWK